MSPRITTALLAVSIVLAGSWLYVRALDRVPPYLIHDEAQGALQAHAIATTGRDISGRWLPMYFTEPEFPPGRDPVLIYVTAIGLKFLDFSEAGARTPTALIAVLNLVLMFFAARAIFDSTWAGLLAAAMMALTPMHFIRGRLLLSPLYSIPFVLGWLWSLRRFEQRPSTRGFIAACAWLAAGMYSYLAAVVMMPLYMLMSVGLAAKSLRLRGLVIAAAVGVVCLLPMAAWYVTHPERNAQIVNAYQLAGDRSLGTAIGSRVNLYWQFFDPSYLFVSGDASLINSTRTSGLFPWAFAALLPVGLIAIFRSTQTIGWVVAAGFLTAPIVSIISGGIEMNRIMFAIPFAVLVAAHGAVALWRGRSMSKAAAAALVVSIALQFIPFHRYYMSDAYRTRAAPWLSGNVREGMRELVARSGNAPAVYISTDIEWVHRMWRFYAIEASREDLIGRTFYYKEDLPPMPPAGSMLICPDDAAGCTALAASGSWRDVVKVPTVDGGRMLIIFERTAGSDKGN